MYGVAWFGILGPLEVTAAGRLLRVSGRSQRELLAVLLLRANRLVSIDLLIESAWPHAPPASARRQVQNAVGRLRITLTGGGLPGDLIETRPGGYLLRAMADELDMLAFERHVEESRRASAGQQWDKAVARLRAALALWRGQPLPDLDNDLVVAEARRLQERRVEVLEECLDLELRLGRHHQVAGELAALAEEHPLRERVCALLMLALYRDGRTAEALRAYQRTRQESVSELGLEPGPELRRLEQAILTGDDSLKPEPAVLSPVRPRQLPPDISDFIGREGVAEELHGLFREGGAGNAVTVVSIAGQAGVGKTTLAVHVAHRLTGRFPDGQLYVNLQAYPMAPVDVLARFLRALSLPEADLPRGLEERAEEYRSRLADRRVLVVLDNAVDEAQVRPLIPGGPGCGVLVTSRRRLAGLPGARLTELEVLSVDQAVNLLARILGRERVTAEPRAARRLARLCGGLPLALRIAGARLLTQDWPLERLVDAMADERGRLDELSYSDLEVRASLALSHRGLSEQAQRLLRLLAHLYAPDVAAWTCAALLDLEVAEVRPLIAELVEAQLLAVSGTRYHLHDLVRLYAKESGTQDPAPAVARALGGWLALAERAHIVLSGGDFATLHGTAPRWTPAVRERGAAIAEDPLAWYDTERVNLVMAVRQAADAGLDELCWDLVASSYTLFLTRAHNDDWEETLRCALAATRTGGNRRGTAVMLMGLGLLGAYRHQYAEAVAVLEESVDTFRDLGETRGLVYALGVAAHVDGMLGRYEQAVVRHEDALRAHRARGDRGAEILLLRSLGQLLVEIGAFDRALPYLEQALEAGRAGDPRILAEVFYWLGQLRLGCGEIDGAEAAFKEMLGISEELRDPREEAEARYGLGLVRLETGALGAAIGLLREALELNRPLGEPLTDGRIRVALGMVHHRRGEARQAIDQLSTAISIFAGLDTPLWQARACRALSEVHGDAVAARRLRERARDLFLQVGSPEAEHVHL
ncbi:transcriptional regulator, SARP family [[Actinomadura] parvosata subsp. kistnae]|uniref:AfsR/SARP family transcriptional regulator n=1 Tax=[Actinomadura] parvosata TaxID=1955412 RepID=UPI000D2726E9|nr:transcriptional regulator, SARP family [Actinomadura parvosata subsp. kistnae]